MKNHMQNRMRDNQLNDCLVIYTEKDIFIDIENEKIIQSFHNMKRIMFDIPNFVSRKYRDGYISKAMTHITNNTPCFLCRT